MVAALLTSALRKAAVDAVGEIDQLVSVSKSADVIVRIATEHAERVIRGMFVIENESDGSGAMWVRLGPDETRFIDDSDDMGVVVRHLDAIVAAALARAEEEQPWA